MLKLDNIKIREDITDEAVLKYACKKYGINFNEVKKYSIFSKSIDARNKEKILYIYEVDICVKNEGKILKRVKKDVSISENKEYVFPVKIENNDKKIVIDEKVTDEHE